MNKCLLKHKDLGIGHGKECCCICSHIFEAEVCNCSKEWPESVFQQKSFINKNHGRIGWACTALAFEGSITIMKPNHGGCELFLKRSDREIKKFKKLLDPKREKKIAQRLKKL